MEHTQTSQFKKSCLFYGEASSERKVLLKIKDVDKFKNYYAKDWNVIVDSASGGSAETILKRCRDYMVGKSYDLVICFIDTDKLKDEHGKKWEDVKSQLEENYSEIEIFWQEECLEDELCRSFGLTSSSKHKIKQYAVKNIEKIIHGEYWKRIIEYFKE